MEINSRKLFYYNFFGIICVKGRIKKKKKLSSHQIPVFANFQEKFAWQHRTEMWKHKIVFMGIKIMKKPKNFIKMERSEIVVFRLQVNLQKMYRGLSNNLVYSTKQKCFYWGIRFSRYLQEKKSNIISDGEIFFS